MWPTLVLTAGQGTRARPLSYVRAKPAFPVAGVPLAGRILRSLATAGVRDVVLNLHHLAHTITRTIGDGTGYGVRVRYSWEQQLMGSAGGPRRALSILDAPRFLIVNGDTVCDVDLGALCRQHAEQGARVTMALVPHPEPGRYGGVLVDEADRVIGFTPQDTTAASWHFVGIQAVDASVFAGLSADRPSDSVATVYRDLIAREPGSVRAFRSHARFRDVGTPADYLQTSLDLSRDERTPGPLTGDAPRIDPSAFITQSVLWDRVSIGAEVELDQCVVADDVIVPGGSRFARSAIVRVGDAEPGPGDIVEGLLIVSPLAHAARAKPHAARVTSRVETHRSVDRGKGQDT